MRDPRPLPSGAARRSLALAFTVIATTGCTKTPEELCKQLDAVEPTNTEADHGRCVRAWGRFKEVDPDAYKALGKCVSILDARSRDDCIQRALSSPKLQADHRRLYAERDDAQRKSIAELLSLELTQTFEGKIGLPGKEPVAFKIHVPAPLKQRGTGGDSTSVPKHVEYGDIYLADDYGSSAVDIVVEASDDPTLQSIDTAMKAKYGATALKKEATPTGFILETQTSFSFDLVVTAAVKGNTIKCWATLTDAIQRESADKLLPWLEKMCTSIELK